MDYKISIELQIPYQEGAVVCKNCALEFLKQGIKALKGGAA